MTPADHVDPTTPRPEIDLRDTWDGSCSECDMGNQYVNQHAPGCSGYVPPAPAPVPVVGEPTPDTRPDTESLRSAARLLHHYVLADATVVEDAADWIDGHRCTGPDLSELRAARDTAVAAINLYGLGGTYQSTSAVQNLVTAVNRLLATEGGE